MCYRVKGFLAVAWFGSFPLPSPLSRLQVVSLSQSSCVSLVELADGGGEGGEGEGDKSYDGEKAWSSILHKYSLVYTVLVDRVERRIKGICKAKIRSGIYLPGRQTMY